MERTELLADATTHRPRVQATAFTVTCWPAESDSADINARMFSVTVERTTDTQWAVRFHGGRCLSVAGTWDWEPLPGGRTDEWLAEHRFDLDTALNLAKAAAPLVKVGGRTVAQALEWLKTRQTEGLCGEEASAAVDAVDE